MEIPSNNSQLWGITVFKQHRDPGEPPARVWHQLCVLVGNPEVSMGICIES